MSLQGTGAPAPPPSGDAPISDIEIARLAAMETLAALEALEGKRTGKVTAIPSAKFRPSWDIISLAR